jgi:hypothetical protein
MIKMCVNDSKIYCFFILYCISFTAQAFNLTEDGQWKLKMMLRPRFETDWNVYKPGASTPRADRHRLRLAGTAELQYLPNSQWNFGLRVAIANDNRGSYGNVDLVDFQNFHRPGNNIFLDKWYVKYSADHWWFWGGRNTIPFWVQDDFFWDAIQTPAGAAIGGNIKYENHTMDFSIGYFATPDGKYDFNGQFSSFQIIDTLKFNQDIIKGALGFFMFEGEKGGTRHFSMTNPNPNSAYESISQDGSRHYKIMMANFQYVHPFWNKPLTLGADGFWNVQHYSATDSDKITAIYHNDVLGGVLSVKYGSNAKSGDWLIGYSYAYIQALAVHPDFAQSDWSRYDPPGVDMQGHDFKISYTFTDYFTLAARSMLAQRISTSERGNRFRLDFIFNF